MWFMVQLSCYKQRRMNSYGCEIIADKLVEMVQDNIENDDEYASARSSRDLDMNRLDAMACHSACKECENCMVELVEVEPALRHNLPVAAEPRHVVMVEVDTGKVVNVGTKSLIELKNRSEARMKEIEETLKRHVKIHNIKEITDRVDKLLETGVDPERDPEIEGQLTMFDAMPSFAKLERFDEEELREKFMEDF